MAGLYDKEAVLEAQVQQLQEKLVENTSSQVKLRHLRDAQDREKEEWRIRRRMLEEQLATARQECRKLKRESQGSRGLEEAQPTGILHRSLSSQSLPAHISARDRGQPSPTPSFNNYPLYSQSRPTLGSQGAIPLANSTPLGHSHLSGSNSSISSIKSASSALSSTHSIHERGYSWQKLVPDYSSSQRVRSHVPFSSTPRYSMPSESQSDIVGLRHGGSNGHASLSKPHPHTSKDYPASSKLLSSADLGTGGDKTSSTVMASLSKPFSSSSSDLADKTITSPDMELHRSKLKIKQLQKEVSLVNQQLSDKTSSAQNHVEELVLLRTELAQEKASLAIVQQEIRDQAARELGVVRSTYARKIKELEAELKRRKAEREKLDLQVQELRTKVKGSDSECWRLREQVGKLEAKMEEERGAHIKVTNQLRAEVEAGCNHIAQLEGALQQCRVEMEGHMTRLEEDSTHHTTQVWQMKSQVERLSEELRQKESELARRAKSESRLQKEVENVKVELKRGHTSWQRLKKELKEQLLESEVSKENLLKQLAEASRKMALFSVRAEGEREVREDMESCRLEMQRLEGVVRREIEERKEMETEADRWKMERDKMEKRWREAQSKEEEAERRWLEERNAKAACEQEGEELRREVGRLSEELKLSQNQLQGEMEGKAEKERNMEETLSHLQQELAKRAQQVLEMDRLLQSHQAETTARRLQLERTLSQRQGEVKSRTEEVEELTSRISEQEETITELRAQLALAKEDQKNLFSGSQAQLLARDSKVSELDVKLKEAESEVAKATEEAKRLEERVAESEEREKHSHLVCQQLQDKVQAMSKEQDSLHTKHSTEVQRLQEMHSSQLNSREEQASAHRQQLQHLAQQERARQEELSRCRTQVASLSAELSAEQSVSEESREQVAAARAQAKKYQTQVADLQSMVTALQDMLEQQTMGVKTTPTTRLGATPTHELGVELTNGAPRAQVTMATNFENEVDFVMLPNHHLKTSRQYQPPTSIRATPTSPLTPVTPPTPKKGSIISI